MCPFAVRAPRYHRLEAFLGSAASASSPSFKGSPSGLEVVERTDLPALSPYSLRPGLPSPGWPSPLRHPITPPGWCRNVDRLPIDYASRPRLRSRLTLGGLTFPRNPWVCGEQVSHLFSRYSYRHSHFRFVHQSSRSDFYLPRNAPLPLIVYRYTISPKLRWCA